ncbi:unnamed protein product [Rotaria magnacalcarata]|uniref:Uncharacterized protein n=1 Tax=Rotaria magnacalcarata TaxID=392030 RepID=A0A814VZG9_9BILA|nr:unnamed protein product [Rotaria magnacalcarata]
MERSKLNSNHKDTTRNSSFESIAICLELSPLHHLLIEVLKSKQEDPYELSCHLIIAYENDIERLNVSIEERTRLLEENNLNAQQVKQLADDVGTRFLSNIFLRQLKNEQARRLAQQQQQ